MLSLHTSIKKIVFQFKCILLYEIIRKIPSRAKDFERSKIGAFEMHKMQSLHPPPAAGVPDKINLYIEYSHFSYNSSY